MAGPTVSGKKRLFVALGGIAFIFILLIIRLFWIQIIDGKRLSEMAQEQQTQDTSLSAARGTITDTNGVVLAQSGTAYKVLLNPYQLSRKQEDLPRIVRELSDILDLDSEYVMKQATKKNSNDVYYKEVILKRQVEREVVVTIEERIIDDSEDVDENLRPRDPVVVVMGHVDHGKTTIVDELLKQSGVFRKNQEVAERVMDSNDIERERGITIKLNAVELNYHAKDGEDYIFHLIDTPGHVDFTYEVSRALAACEGALLVIDATQGIEAQTLANVYLALDNDLEIIPVINKIDLPSADPERVKHEIEDVIGIDASEAVLTSAKTGIGIEDVLEAIVAKIPAPKGDAQKPLKALVFDSKFDAYKGVVLYFRVIDGCVRKGMKIRMMATGAEFEVTEVGVFKPNPVIVDELDAGQVGFLAAAIKNVKDARVGDTITDANNPADEALPGYRKATPMVYCGLYPVENSDYDNLRDALEKLQLNDASLVFEPETSVALGFGFRCGFLGLLHMDVIKERLEREYNLALITTAPNVIYEVFRTNGDVELVDNPSNFPDPTVIDHVEEPYVNATIIVPKDYVGAVMELSQEKRGEYENMTYLDETRVMIHYALPLSEIIFDYFDRLKSATRGYASLDYELAGYRASDLVKVDILLNGDPVDALSAIVHREKATVRGRQLVEKLRSLIPRQMFEIPVQAAIGNKIIARENVRALRKDVLAKCYGGDISRKRKLLEKQKEGKKRMKQVGSVELPQEAFMAILKMD